MIIRSATPDDAPAIAAVVHAIEALRAFMTQAVEETTQAIASNLERIATSDCSAAYLAEKSQGEIVGYGAVHWTPFLFLPGGEAYVTELFILPSASGKKIGSAILETMVAEATRRGCSRVSLLNNRDSEAYRRSFYKKHGWIERDQMANFILPIRTEPSENQNPEPSSEISAIREIH